MRPIILIRPPSQLGILTSIASNQHPINLLYIASSLIEKGGYKVEIWDFEINNLTKEKIYNKISKIKPDIVGISCMTPLMISANEIAKSVKKASPKTEIVVGGSHPSALPIETLKEFKNFDIVIIGEGEETFLELANRISRGKSLKGVKGIAYRKNKKIILEKPRPLTYNLDSIPFPARELLDLEAYRGAGRPGLSHRVMRITQIFTSRGCPYQCIFCATHITHPGRIRFRSVKNILEEIKECKEKLSINHFTIHDDTFNLIPERVKELCKGLKELGITWDCDTRVNMVDRESIKMMAMSGCIRIAFGVESGSPRILKLIKKGITIPEVINAFKWAKESGIQTSAYFMICSHPSETIEEIRMTKRLIRKIEPDFANVGISCPYPGTELRKIMKEKHLFINEDKWENYAFYCKLPKWRTENFSPEQLVKIQAQMMRNFYLRPSYIFKHIRKIKSLNELIYWVKSGIATIVYILEKKR